MRFRRLLALLLLLVLICPYVLAEEAPELTEKCSYLAGSAKKDFRKCHDGKYTTYWRSGTGTKAWIRVTMPKGSKCSGVYIQWYETPVKWQLQVLENGEWVTAAECDTLFYNEYLELPENAEEFRIATAKGEKGRLSVAELHIYGEGEKSAKAQCWQPSSSKADLLIIAAHPDDEILWFGGIMPYYAGELGLSVQVCEMVPTMPYRRIELLDCLWTCGVREYPVWGNYPDVFSNSLKKAYEGWSENRVLKTIVGWYRRFSPNIVIAHDIKGEYGHGAHRLCADACIKALSLSRNPEKYPESAKNYGTWDVPKLYVHLYAQNVMKMDWDQPLTAFDGRTAEEVAKEAFACHISQQKIAYRPENSGPYDNSLFGLYRSLVGEDTVQNDMLQNLPGYDSIVPASSENETEGEAAGPSIEILIFDEDEL